MLGWAVTFLVIALIAAILGFGGIAGVAIEIAKIIFFVALLLFLISAVFGLMGGRRGKEKAGAVSGRPRLLVALGRIFRARNVRRVAR